MWKTLYDGCLIIYGIQRADIFGGIFSLFFFLLATFAADAWSRKYLREIDGD
jgi:hypothetical protein